MSNILRGAVTRLVIGGATLTGETRCSVSLTLKTRKYASFDELHWEQIKNDISSWTADGEGLLTSPTAAVLAEMLVKGEAVSVAFTVHGTQWRGQAIPTDLSLNGATDGKAKWRISFKGTGPISV